MKKATEQEQKTPQLDPSNTRLWVAIILFAFLVQDVFVPNSVLVRFIDNLLYGLIFQFFPRMTEPLVLIQQGFTYLLLAWLFLRSVHRHMGSLGASRDAWKTGLSWGLASIAGSDFDIPRGGYFCGIRSVAFRVRCIVLASHSPVLRVWAGAMFPGVFPGKCGAAGAPVYQKQSDSQRDRDYRIHHLSRCHSGTGIGCLRFTRGITGGSAAAYRIDFRFYD